MYRKRPEIIATLLLICLLVPESLAASETRTTSQAQQSEKATVLPTLVVKPRKYKMLHLIGYVREYSTLSTYYDTIQLFREKTVDFMIPASKSSNGGWLNPRLLASRSCYRFANYEGLDSVSDRFREHFSWSDWMSLFRKAEIPSGIYANETHDTSDTILNSNAISSIWHRIDDDNLTLYVDLLVDKKNHSWLPGLSNFLDKDDATEFRQLKITYHFTDIESRILSPQNVSRFDVDIRSGGRGRNLRHIFHTSDTIYVDTHAEFFITDKEYLSSSEAAKWTKHPPKSDEIGIHAPAEAPDIFPQYADIVSRTALIDRDKLRRDAKSDKLLIGPRYNNLMKKNYGPIGATLNFLKKIPGWIQKHI